MREKLNLMTADELIRAEALTGCLDGLDERGQVYFLPDGAQESVPVVLGLAAPDAVVIRAALAAERALVVRAAGEPGQLVLMGLLRDRVEIREEAGDAEVLPEPVQEQLAPAPAERPDEAVIDGKTVRFEARDEIVLRCGQGSITLRKDGKIVIKGTQLLSRASGVNRIKGGQVNIN